MKWEEFKKTETIDGGCLELSSWSSLWTWEKICIHIKYTCKSSLWEPCVLLFLALTTEKCINFFYWCYTPLIFVFSLVVVAVGTLYVLLMEACDLPLFLLECFTIVLSMRSALSLNSHTALAFSIPAFVYFSSLGYFSKTLSRSHSLTRTRIMWRRVWICLCRWKYYVFCRNMDTARPHFTSAELLHYLTCRWSPSTYLNFAICLHEVVTTMHRLST